MNDLLGGQIAALMESLPTAFGYFTSKRMRPLASGTIPLADAVLAVPILFVISLAIASSISLPFLGVLLGYYALTTAYSFVLKRMLIADVLALACLYTVRVVGGGVALGVAVVWLVRSTMF